MSTTSTTSATSTTSIMQQLSSITDPGGIGIPVQQYATAEQDALTASLTTVSKNQLSTLTASQTALTSLQTALAQLQAATDTLSSSQTWNPVTVVSSNPTALSVTASAGATASSYSVAIGTLAQNQVNFSTSGFQTSATGASSLTGGTIDILMASGTSIDITVKSGESLSAIATAVDLKSIGVQASVIDNGSSTTPYQLVFQSTNTGTASAFTLTDGTGSNLISTQLGAGTITQAATNATATLDGSVALQSSTNTFTNAIPNITFTALQANSSSVISASGDTSTVVSSVQTWMNAYNSVIDLLSKDTSYTPATSSAAAQTGPLFTDPNASGLMNQLPSAVGKTIGTAPANFQNLASLGIVTDPTTGHLEFQSSTGFSGTSATLQDGQTMFTNALTSNPSAVQALFGVMQSNTASSAIPTSGILADLTMKLTHFGTISGTGTIGNELTSISAQQTNINSYLTQVNQQITSQVNNFTSQLNTLNAALVQTESQTKILTSLINSSSSSTSTSSSSTSSGG